MEITLGFVIAQIMIGIIGYAIHQFTSARLGWVLLGASAVTFIIPLFTLESQELFPHYLDVFPSHALGAGIGFAVTVVIHWIRDKW